MSQTNDQYGGCSTGLCGVTYRRTEPYPDPTDYIGQAAEMLSCDRGDLAAGLVTRLELAARMVRRAGGELSSRTAVALLIIGYQDANPGSHLVIPR